MTAYHPSFPTRLLQNDGEHVDLLCKRTGLTRSEVIRRAARALSIEVAKRPDWNWVQETARELPPLTEAERAELSDGPMEGFDAVNARALASSEAGRRPKSRRGGK